MKLDQMRTVHWWGFEAMWCPTAGWLRVFGYGLRWTDIRSWGLNFSQRNGYERYRQFGPWTVSVLRPYGGRFARRTA